MKKLATLLITMVGAGFAFGQITHVNSTIIFNAVTTGAVDRKIHDSDGSLLTGTTYVAELYGPTAGGSLQPLPGSIVHFKALTTSAPGTWSGKTFDLTIVGAGGLSVGPTVVGGGIDTLDADGSEVQTYPIQMQVAVWDLGKFATYAAAAASPGAHYGLSAPFTYTQRFTGNTSDTQMVTAPGITLVPEPSAIALSVMGVAGLLLIRRRK